MPKYRRGYSGIGSPAQYVCSPCGKHSYHRRKDAKRLARELRQRQDHEAVLSTYPCPYDATRWHVGHDHLRQRLIDGGAAC